MAKIKSFLLKKFARACVRLCLCVYLLEILVIRTEACLLRLVDLSTGSLIGVGSKLGRRTCQIAERCATSRF